MARKAWVFQPFQKSILPAKSLLILNPVFSCFLTLSSNHAMYLPVPFSDHPSPLECWGVCSHLFLEISSDVAISLKTYLDIQVHSEVFLVTRDTQILCQLLEMKHRLSCLVTSTIALNCYSAFHVCSCYVCSHAVFCLKEGM